MDNNRASYIIDKGNNVVVAEITGCLFDAEDMMNNRFIPSVTSGFQLANTGNNKFDMNRNYKAVAKLHQMISGMKSVVRRLRTISLLSYITTA